MTSREEWRAVVKVDQVPSGDILATQIDGVDIVVGRDGDRFFALQRRCVHQGGDLADGIISRGDVICPHHGLRFSTTTGRAPELPGQAPHCLARYAVRVVGEWIEVGAKQ